MSVGESLGRNGQRESPNPKLTPNMLPCFRLVMAKSRRNSIKSDTTAVALMAAAEQVRLAASACWKWERGGDAEPVTETAAIARQTALVAFEAVTSDETWGDPLDEPATRRGRLAHAGWLVLLAGIDEHGEGDDLDTSAQLFERAAEA
jgi:hypothetical protein